MHAEQESRAERWLPVPGYEGLYEVSDQGRVRSIDRVVPHGAKDRLRRLKGKILSPKTDKRIGYRMLMLSLKGSQTARRVHNLVTEAFIGPRPDGLQVRHLNGDPADNRLCNLVYGTAAENIRDIVRHGKHNHARKTHCKYGHAFTPDNLEPSKEGDRRCSTCRRIRGRVRRPERAA